MAKGLDYAINIKDGDFGGVAHAKSEMQGMDSAVEHTHGGLGNLKEMAGKLAAAFGIAFAVDQVVEFGKQSFEVYEKTEQAQAQIVAGIKSTANAAGLSLDDLTKQADILAHKTLFTQEQTEGAQAIQLSFTNIKGAIFNEAIPAIEDFATRMGTDINAAALQVGKALQDPIKGVTSLQREGVRLSESQKAMVVSMVHVGNTAGAQTLILNELNKEFAGSAEAARIAKGAMGDLDEETHDLKEGFGKLISDGLEAVVPTLVNVMHWMGENKNIMIDVAKVVGIAGAAWALYEAPVLVATVATSAWGVITTGAAIIGQTWALVTGEITAAQWALNVAMDANPIGIIVVGIGAFVGLLYEAYEHSEVFRASLSGIGEVAGDLWGILKGLGEVVIGVFTLDTDKIKEGLMTSANSLMDVTHAFSRGYDNSITESHKKDADEKKKEGELKKGTGTASDLVKPHGKDAPIPGGKGTKGSGGSSTTLSGGRSVRNVQITIGKLVERIEVHTTNLQNVSTKDIKRQLTELLTEAVHDGELALGSQ